MDRLNQIVASLHSTETVDFTGYEFDTNAVAEDYRKLSQHEQGKVLHLVYQLFLKTTKILFPPLGNPAPLSSQNHDALYKYCLHWILIVSTSFAGTPLTIMNMFLNDTFRFDKMIDGDCDTIHSKSTKLFAQSRSALRDISSYPASGSLTWCLLCTFLPQYSHLRLITINTLTAILQAKNFHVWVQQTFYRKHLRLEKDNKLVQMLNRFLKLATILIYRSCNSAEEVKDSISLLQLTLQTFGETPHLATRVLHLFSNAVQALTVVLYHAFELSPATPLATSSGAKPLALSPRAIVCIQALQQIIGMQKYVAITTQMLQATFDCVGCEAFYVEFSSKSVDGKFLVMSVLMGMMKNKDDRSNLMSLLKLILRRFASQYFGEFARVHNFLARLVLEPQETMRIFAGEWISYLWEAIQATSMSASETSPATILSDSQLQQMCDQVLLLLHDESHLVRASAALAIRYFPKSKWLAVDWSSLIQTLLPLTDDKIGKVRGAAQGALGDLSRAPDLPYQSSLQSVFVKGCRDSSLIVRIEAFWALSKYLPLRWLPARLSAGSLDTLNASLFQSEDIRALLDLYQHAIVQDSDKVVPSLVLGYLSFVVVGTTMSQSASMQQDLILSQIRHEIDTRLQKQVSAELLLRPDLWDDYSAKNYKEITNIFALVFCLDVFADVQHQRGAVLAINKAANSLSESVWTLNMTLWDRVFALLQSKRVYLQLQASQWLFACLFSQRTCSVTSLYSQEEGEYPRELYLRLFETILDLFFKTSQRLKRSNQATQHSEQQSQQPQLHSSTSRVLVLKRILLLWIARMVHIALLTTTYSDLINQVSCLGLKQFHFIYYLCGLSNY
jgi:hypothetical protein